MLRSRLLEQFDWLEHGFGERTDTIGQSTHASVKQIHSNTCFAVEAPGVAGQGDALVTRTPGLAVSIRTADCIPLLLVDPATPRVVAAIHAGWRGTAAKIAQVTIDRMRVEYGSRVQDIVAAIGPGIGGCCYEVGEEVAHLFLSRTTQPGSGGTVVSGEDCSHAPGAVRSRLHLDLAAANRQQLIDAGVPEAQIDTAGICTFCDAARFWSWRREKEQAGRMVSYVKITG